MPAAYASHIRPRFSILSRSNRHCVVSGCDLIYKIPATLNSSGDALFSVITANPAYWKGTRIGRIAPAYQTYRPLSFKVSYIPQVAVTQSGTVFMGTLWDMAPPQDNLQQSLLTSNGGQLTQCYIPADSTVALGRNLQQNLFKMTGALSTDTNPFIFCVGVAGANVIPGYLYVTYQYELRNPIGDSWTFINSGITTVSALPLQDNTANGCVVLMNQVSTLGPGTIIDREAGASSFFYRGSQLDLPEQTSVIYLNNFQTFTNTAARNIDLTQPLEVTHIIEYGQNSTHRLGTFSDFAVYTNQTINKGKYYFVRQNINTKQFEISAPGFANPGTFNVPSDYKYWFLYNNQDVFYIFAAIGNAVMGVPTYSQTYVEAELYFTKLPLNYVIEGLPL